MQQYFLNPNYSEESRVLPVFYFRIDLFHFLPLVDKFRSGV